MTTLGEDYLAQFPGKVRAYHLGLSQGLRIGQAFFDALPYEDQNLLRGTLIDPFYRDGNACVEAAVEFLLRD